jgi:hypothetical protein
MRKWWVGYLLALFALLWAKLPGPSAQEEPDPSREFRCKHIDTEKGVAIEVSTEVRRILWLSKRTKGITIQKVEPRPDGWYAAEEAPLKSRIEVNVTSPYTVELHGLKPEIGERLTSGIGHYAIVTGTVEKGQFGKQEDMIVEGKGQGTWRILRPR